MAWCQQVIYALEIEYSPRSWRPGIAGELDLAYAVQHRLAEYHMSEVVMEQMETKPPARSGRRPVWMRWIVGERINRTLVRALVLAFFSYLVFGHVFRPVLVRGRSMEPTVRDGTLRFANLVAFRFREPRHGDIVVVRMAGPRMFLLKRVLGVPGDQVRFDRGVFWLNGEPLDESYLVHRGTWTTAAYTLRPGEFYVAGDNRSSPYREHATGVTDRSNIAGALLF